MIRAALGRVATAGAAATAAASGASTSQANAHARPARAFPSQLADDRSAKNDSNSVGIQDGRIMSQLQGDEVLFSAEEIDETVDDVFGMVFGRTRYTLVRIDSPETSETDDEDANAIIDQARIVPMGTANSPETSETDDEDANAIIDQASIVPMGTANTTANAEDATPNVAEAVKIMLKRPSYQQVVDQARKEDPRLRRFFQFFAPEEESGLDEFTNRQRLALPGVPVEIEDVTDSDQGQRPPNLFQAVMNDIARGLKVVGQNLLKAAKENVGNFFSQLGQWLAAQVNWKDANDGMEKDGNGERKKDKKQGSNELVCVVTGIALVVVAILYAKKSGVRVR